MESLGNDLVAKSGKKWHCVKCDYKCCKKYNWEKHLLTSKHTKEINGNDLEIEKWQKGQNKNSYSCVNCNKFFTHFLI